jgi:predicted peptidase
MVKRLLARLLPGEMKARFIVSLSLLVVCLLVASDSYSQGASSRRVGQHPHRIKKQAIKTVTGQYLLFLPRDYGKSRKQYPLIMYLHGGSLRGDDVEKVRTLGLPQIVEQDKSFPFIVVSPLCPAGEIWTDTDLLIGILDEVVAKYPVDQSRVYLTGHSMGGRGAWYLAYKHPERFAAVAPMSGGPTITAWASKLKDVPVWAFHGAKDDIVPLSESEGLVKAIKAAGGDVKLTLLPDRDHFILDMYENKLLYDWFLQHRRNR